MMYGGLYQHTRMVLYMYQNVFLPECLLCVALNFRDFHVSLVVANLKAANFT